MKGLFVVFEGITGSGKKTQIKMIQEELQLTGKNVMTISFPNFETPMAKLTKRLDLDPMTLSLLHAADRSFYQERIKSLVASGYVILCDRYSYSNFAYQAARGVDLDWLIQLERNTIKPSLVFLIDIPVSESFGRVQQLNIEDFTKKEILDRLEREKEQLEKIRNGFLFLAKNPDPETEWIIIDGTKPLEETHKIILSEIDKRLE